LNDPQRILIVRTDRLGDVLLTLPMLALLRSRYPTALLGMMLGSYAGEIVRGHPHVNVFIRYDHHGIPRPGNELLREIRSHAFDTVIVVHPTPRLAWLMFRAGVPVRIGTGYRFYSSLFTHRVYEHRKDARLHELEYNVRLLRVLDPAFTEEGLEPEYGIIPDPLAVESVRARLAESGVRPGEQLIVIHPGSGGSARDWPPDRFALLGSRLSRRAGLRIAVTGGKGEESVVQGVAKGIGGEVLSFPGTLSLPELTALLARSSLVVANSTGPLHLGAALGIPVVGIYPQLTPMSPRRWGPYTSQKRVLVPDAPADCRDCRNGERCRCIEKISVDQVFQASQELLQQTSGQGRRRTAHA
jgi:ADP-heptose:LPS heptosyltransferase